MDKWVVKIETDAGKRFIVQQKNLVEALKDMDIAKKYPNFKNVKLVRL